MKNKVTVADLTFEVDITSVFEIFPINAKALSSRIGMNYTLLSQYASGKKKPSQKQANRILEGIHEVGRELMEIHFV